MEKYPKEYKIEAVKYYIENGRNCNRTAKELGIPDPTLRVWIKKHMNEIKKQEKEKPIKRDYESELREKDKLIKHLEGEVEILKKSIGIFTRNPLQK